MEWRHRLRPGWDAPSCGPWFSGASTLAKAALLGPKGKLTWTEAGSNGQRQLWAGTNRVPVCFFPSAAAASRPGAVFSVEGAPENRAGKSSVASHLPCPQLGSQDWLPGR